MPDRLIELGVMQEAARRLEGSGLGRADAQDPNRSAHVFEVRAGKNSEGRRRGRGHRGGCPTGVNWPRARSMKFFEAIANIFRIPDLRKRVLFTLGLLAVYRLGSHIPTPGININRWQDFFSRKPGHHLRLLRSVRRRQYPPVDHLRPGHHALHHGVDHPAVADRGRPHSRKAAEGRRARPPQDHAVDPLPDGRAWR